MKKHINLRLLSIISGVKLSFLLFRYSHYDDFSFKMPANLDISTELKILKILGYKIHCRKYKNIISEIDFDAYEKARSEVFK